MPGSGLLGGRYRLEDAPIGEGGMGVVYRAIDTGVGNRRVAVKTLNGPVDHLSVEQFRKEWDALADLCHANIINVYDVGEFADRDGKKPYFVMPLLRGADLAKLLESAGFRLDAERLVGIVAQVCKGLQSAHNRGIVHRDLKPSNIFLLDDDTVILIDFGVAHLVSSNSGEVIKGTLPYMAPEQLEGKATPQSDIFSLAVVCYEALTGRKPFQGETVTQVMDAIRTHIPPSISDLNPAVPFPIAQVIHRALAKQPYHRIASAKEFAVLLQRALDNDSIAQLDRARIEPRLGRIKKALSEGDAPYAKELVCELQAQGYIDPEISLLRIQIEEAGRVRLIQKLLDSARLRADEGDYPLAMADVQGVLDLDPRNIDALALKREVEQKRGTAGVEKWYQIACQHRDNRLFGKAREALAEIKKIDPNHGPAAELLAEITQSEQEQTHLRGEMQRLYVSALKAYGTGEISTALKKLERIIELAKRVSGHTQTFSEYERLYNQVRLERDQLQASYAEARAALESGDLKRARDICNQVLEQRPRDPLFKALEIEVGESERQIRSAAVAEMHSQIQAEANLEAKFQLAKAAIERFPQEQTFADTYRLIKQKRDLVNGIVARAREYESQSRFAEARNEWDTLRNIYPQYPGLDYELERLERRQQESSQEQFDSGERQLLSSLMASPAANQNPVPWERFEDEHPAVPQSGSQIESGESLDFAPPHQPERVSNVAESAVPDVWFKTEPIAAKRDEPQEREPVDNAPAQVRSIWQNPAYESFVAASGTTPGTNPGSERAQRHYRDKLEEGDQDRGTWLAPRRIVILSAVIVGVAALVLTFLLLRSSRASEARLQSHTAAVNPPGTVSGGSVSPPAAGSTPVPSAVTPGDKPKSNEALASSRRIPLVPVNLRSDPEPATVRADHKTNLQCETPCSLNLPSGEHTFVFTAPNREPVSRILTVPDDGDISVELPLATALVQVISNPAGLKITVDGQEKGSTPVKLRLTVGQHHLTVSANGVTKDQTIDVGNEDEGFKIVTIDLAPTTAPAPGT